MKQLACSALAAVALGGCGAEPTATEVSTSTAAVTIDDVDFAPECEGILIYANWASFQELDSYLPSDVASAIEARRAVRPFVSIEDLSSVPGVAQGRLQQITSRAHNLDFIDIECAGVYEELAVSYEDRVKILAYVNTASEAALWDVVRTEPNTVAPLLISRRPFTTLQRVVDTEGVGPSTFRSIRDAAIVDPFDELVGRVNTAPQAEVTIKTAFNWYAVASDQPGHQTGMECFGVPADLVNAYGGVLRPNLATASEAFDQVSGTVGWANRFGGVGPSAAGLAHLAAQLSGHLFFGCYISFEPNPWCGFDRAFFVNKDTGWRVLTETSWCE